MRKSQCSIELIVLASMAWETLKVFPAQGDCCLDRFKTVSVEEIDTVNSSTLIFKKLFLLYHQ